MMVVDALRNLAAPAEVQIAHLQRLGVAPSCDELALELDDAIRRPGLPDHLLTSVAALNDELGRMSGEHNASLWTFDALRTAPEWEHVRSLAAKALGAA